jgi:drug/metabolite transporter (DMT)-like permease
MTGLLFPVALAVFGGVLYHVAQKSAPAAINPFAAIILAYALGIALCAVCMRFDPAAAPIGAALREMNWAIAALAVGAVMIEIGVLLTYRAGMKISLASVTINIAVALTLIPIGLFAYREHLSIRNSAGIACCLIGLYLISQK